MSVPDRFLDPPETKACLACKLRELAASLTYLLEDAGVPLKYAKEYADEDVQEAKAHFDPTDFRTCKGCFEERAD